MRNIKSNLNVIITKMRQAKITCIECDCQSLPDVIRNKIRGDETLTHTFTKRTEDKTKTKYRQKNLVKGKRSKK